METYELRYFVAVARQENLHRAADDLHVSPGSLSKAIARLEDELGVRLFQRIGRNIRLTDDGKVLLARATAIVSLEESTRIELSGARAAFQVRMMGPEILLAKVGPNLAAKIRAQHPQATFVFQAAAEDATAKAVASGEVQLGVTTSDKPAGLTEKRLFASTFKTCVGRGHPLFKSAEAGKTVPVGDVLLHPFVSPGRPILGLMAKHQAVDGWRDDKFPRQIAFVADSLQLVEELVLQGQAVAYLPDYYIKQIEATPLKISGCPYSCTQTARLLARNPKDTGWIRTLFGI